ncbi:MAG: chromosome segregation protein SMC [Lachnospiraceae bacterium]|nr:chromosome segregation protein SMC [Lachnospiraceae bacterium]
MYLKKIEIQGFKSFANKTVFEFNDGVTGIVGPNGSGKSNVSDAVRWVLGEQSAKQLRGGNMQDVIFAGTQLRKPQGFAFVALTLDNSDHQIALDFDEVVVSRRLYRSGESEYMLNGSQCRLKDIHELFYDTGIGKDGYSIIGQGQIDKILSSKPEDRRELFDEAVGITKYKRRKLLTQKKLDNEHQNLIRISDIIRELETRVGPLEKQSQTAKEYLRLRDQLRKYDVNLFLRDHAALNNEIKEIDGNYEILTADLDSANEESDKLKEQYEYLEALIDELDKTITETREQISAANIEIGDMTGKINVLNEQINTDRANAEHYSSRIAAIEADIGSRETALDSYRVQEAENNTAFEEAKKAQIQAEQALSDTDASIARLEKCIEDAQAGVIAALNERSDINASSEAMQATLEQLQLRKSESAQKILKSKSDVATIQSKFDEENKKLEDINSRIEGIDEKGRKLLDEYETAEKEAEKLALDLSDLQGKVQSVSAKLESLKNIAERYEGYGNSVKRVMEQSEKTGGVHGVVADLIKVDKEYETAIETALGGKIQNIVTDDESTAKKLISFLKEEKLGRATFLPLSAMKENTWNAGSVMTENGVIGLASSLVKTDLIYKGLIDHLLGKTIVLDNIDDAIALQKRHGYEYHVVTKEGEYLAPGGSISGGTYKNSSNLLGRKREIDELTDTLSKAKQDVENREAELEEKRTGIKDISDKIQKVRDEKQEALIEKNTVETNMSSIRTRLDEFTDASVEMENELYSVESQITEITSQRSKWQNDLAEIDERQKALDESIVASTEELESYRNGRESLAENYAKTQVVTAGYEQQLEFIRENISRVNDELNGFLTEKETLIAGTAASGEGIADKQQQIAGIEAQIEDKKSVFAELEKTLTDTLEKKDAKSGEQKQYFEKRDAVSERISVLDKDIFRLQNKREKATDKLDSIISYMWNEYELTTETAESYRDEELGDTAEMRRQVGGYKNDIKALGPVNINAIDEYKEVSERYELMRTQHEDIIKAEEQLQNIINELDEGMRKQFEENFARIQVEFDKVFKELFGGGVGKLELDMDEETDLLDAGIRIIAQPPGKKLQNMMQLSGGEKALTAIVLLFAIQNLKPSPFALLDEIEAALDDSNVDRFAHYLKKLSKNTQFIVITHRRGTMVCADRLYGITMQEKGVSTLVSVNLIEDKLDN